MVQARTPHMLFVSQKVIDIKTPLDLIDLAKTIGDLRELLHKYSFIPGDIFTGKLEPKNIDEQGNLQCDLHGSSLGSPTNSTPRIVIQLNLPLGLRNYKKELNPQDIFGAIGRTSIDDGGNIQNMLLNTLVLVEALSPQYSAFDSVNLPITVATSSDPFRKLNREMFNLFEKRVKVYPLGIKDRFAIHLPYEHAKKQGIMAITSEPKETYEALCKLFKANEPFERAFKSATCFISADPFFQILSSYAFPPYAYVINASTAFRALVAVSAYGNYALLPMNQKEAADVCKLMLSRGRGTELDQTEAPPFPSPLTPKEDRIDPDKLTTLDNSIDMFSRHNPFFQHAEGLSFACPISFGEEGGLIIGMNREPIACFSTILSKEGEQLLFEEYSFPISAEIQETGAGDAVATVVALFNTVSPEVLIESYLEGKEKDHSDLRQIASILFVSCLSRIVGNLIVRTPRTNLTHIQIDPLRRLIGDVAEESVKLARDHVGLLSRPTFGVIKKWGIKVAVWVPRRVLIPSGVPVTIERSNTKV